MKTPPNIPTHLPKRLTIAFPIWGLFDTGAGAYHDLDRFVKEHKERGFNCIRLEGGAGLTHNIHGNLRGPIYLYSPFGQYTGCRQVCCFGDEGYCDVMARLIALCEACQKYDVYLILSSWYFLHTYWYLDKHINDELLSAKAEDMFMNFAKLLHYTLSELEARGLSDRIAMAEIFNEVLAVPAVIGELKGEDVSYINFTDKHAEALSWLRQQHPDLLFAVDSDRISPEETPATLQGFNGHNYFLWGVYGGTLENGEPERKDFFLGKYKPEDMAAARSHLTPLSPSCSGWHLRASRCQDLDTSKMPEIEDHLTKRLSENRQVYLDRLNAYCEGFKLIMDSFPGIPVVCGEGVTYCSSQKLVWEENSEEFWDILKIMIKKYKEIGLWGTLIKTCCGPEDPSWELCKDRLKELNEMFLA